VLRRPLEKAMEEGVLPLAQVQCWKSQITPSSVVIDGGGGEHYLRIGAQDLIHGGRLRNLEKIHFEQVMLQFIPGGASLGGGGSGSPSGRYSRLLSATPRLSEC